MGAKTRGESAALFECGSSTQVPPRSTAAAYHFCIAEYWRDGNSVKTTFLSRRKLKYCTPFHSGVTAINQYTGRAFITFASNAPAPPGHIGDESK